jgi:hypothetical protein
LQTSEQKAITLKTQYEGKSFDSKFTIAANLELKIKLQASEQEAITLKTDYEGKSVDC